MNSGNMVATLAKKTVWLSFLKTLSAALKFVSYSKKKLNCYSKRVAHLTDPIHHSASMFDEFFNHV